MIELRQTIAVSFMDLEVSVFQKMQGLCREVMQAVLSELDLAVFGLRDKSRYTVKDIRGATVTTLFGDVEFSRRYYFDKKTGRYVHLLDEVLELGGERVSPALSLAAVFQAVTGPSYRAARDTLKRFYGHQMISHEGIRQILLKVGEAIERDNRLERDKTFGKRKVPMLFIEADGYWVSMQKDKKKRREIRMMLSHEGWEPKTPGSREYDLAEKTHCLEVGLDPEEFWEQASRCLYSKYDIDENTLVVINGDRADWIREGAEYFPNAIYQVDRFHVKRELRRLLRDSPKELRECLDAFDKSEVKRLMACLKESMKKCRDIETSLRIGLLLNSVGKMPESFRDYRLRLKEMGYDTFGLRGLGAAESNVDRFSNRLKKRGQSWCLEGLRAMVCSLVKHFEGKLESYARCAGRVQKLLSSKKMEESVPCVSKRVVSEALRVRRGDTPLKYVGTKRSGGMSKLLWGLDYTGSLIR